MAKKRNVMKNVAKLRLEVKQAEGRFGNGFGHQDRANQRFEQLEEEAYNEYIPKQFRQRQIRTLELARRHASNLHKGVGASKKKPSNKRYDIRYPIRD